MKKYFIFTILSVGAPFIASAATSDIKNLHHLVGMLVGLMNSMIPLLFGLALLAFFWGVIKYIYRGGSGKDEIESARNYMIFSIVGIAVMLSVWGLALFLKNSFFPTAPSPFDPTGESSGGGISTPKSCVKDSDCKTSSGEYRSCMAGYCVDS